MITLRLPRPLWQYAQGEKEIRLTAESLREALARFREQHPQAYERMITEGGELRTHVNIFVNRDLVRVLDGPQAQLKPGDVVTIIPAISGG
ncbi:MAG: MoaD/ThiS family protein [candidate division Zixibacteria bacterium]|nr:MoaD/ThiS family protein [candidate division Zixibacteria bacterium]